MKNLSFGGWKSWHNLRTCSQTSWKVFYAKKPLYAICPRGRYILHEVRWTITLFLNRLFVSSEIIPKWNNLNLSDFWFINCFSCVFNHGYEMRFSEKNLVFNEKCTKPKNLVHGWIVSLINQHRWHRTYYPNDSKKTVVVYPRHIWRNMRESCGWMWRHFPWR